MSEARSSFDTMDRDATGVAAAPAYIPGRPRTAVIGGGVSGLAVGYFLDRAGDDYRLFEASARTGGVIESRRADGQLLEMGPQRTRLTPPMRAVIEALGLTGELILAPDIPLYIYSRGRLRIVPTDLETALSTDLISWADRLRVLVEPLTRAPIPGESTADFFSRKFGRGTYRKAIAPLFGDLYGSDPADMPACHALATMLRALHVEGSLLRALIRGFRTRRRVPACSFRDGLQTLTDAMARRLAERVHTRSAVLAIRREGDRFRVVTESGELDADRVVLTCPADAASRMLAPFDDDASRRLGRLRYNTFAVVHLESTLRFDGSGYQVAFGEGFATRGVTSCGALFDRAGMYTSFLGGGTRPGVTDLPDEALRTLAALEFRAITGAEARPLSIHRTYMPAWDASWNELDGLRLPDGIHVCANWMGRPGITGRLTEAEALVGRLAEA